MNGKGLDPIYTLRADIRHQADRRAARMTTLKYLAVVLFSVVAVVYIVLNQGAL